MRDRLDRCRRAETEAFWTARPRGLVGRGLAGVRLATSDAHGGLKAAIAKVLGYMALGRPTDVVGIFLVDQSLIRLARLVRIEQKPRRR